jgi:hypothetical protein
MARSGAFVTALVAMVLGIGIGVVGVLAAVPKLSPSASDVATDQQNQPASAPQNYGTR